MPPLSRIRATRERLGLSQAELARRIGLTRQSLCRLEGGAWLPNTAVALRLARHLGTTVEALFGEAEDGVVRDPQAPGSARLTVVRIRDRAEAFATEAPAALEPSFAPADALVGESGLRTLDALGLAETTAVLHGCDPAFGILAGLVGRAESTRRVLFRFAGSGAALEALGAGRSHLAGIHLVADPADEATVLEHVRAALPCGGTVVAFARWEQGLVVAPGNPLGVRDVADLAREDVRLVNREAGAGCRVSLDRALARAGVASDRVRGYERTAASHWDAARVVAAGGADVGLGLRAVAEACGLSFVPLEDVRCDLVVPGDLADHPGVRTALDVLQSRRMRDELASLAGYDAAETGTVRAEVEVA